MSVPKTKLLSALFILISSTFTLISNCAKEVGQKGEGKKAIESMYVDPITLCSPKSPQIISYADKVYVAVGYDFANVSMVITSAGKVIIDTGSSPEKARIIKAEFDKISDLPQVAIIYTHSHIDHTGGAVVWLENSKDVQIWGHKNLTQNFFRQYVTWQKLQQERARFQFGFDLSESLLPCFFAGARLFAPKSVGFIPPQNTFDKPTTLVIGNLTFQLIPVQGETKDQTMVWIPELEVLFTGDNFYQSFPNLYTVRGTGERPVEKWIESLNLARRLSPSFLVPGHTSPIEGKNEVRKILREYKDAIEYLWQNFVKLANEGRTPDEIVALIKLPEKFRKNPFLQELYGSVSWSLKGFYSYYIGWFDGKPERLFQLPSSYVAQKEIEAMGGEKRVLFLARKFYEEGNLALSLHFLAKLRDAGVFSSEARELYRTVLSDLAKAQKNFIARAWLFEESLKAEGELEKMPIPQIPDEVLPYIPIDVFFDALKFRLKDEYRKEGIFLSVQFVFTDTGQKFVVTVRDGVVEVVKGEKIPGEPDPSATLVTDTLTYKKLALNRISINQALDKINVQGDFSKLLEFMQMFERFEEK